MCYLTVDEMEKKYTDDTYVICHNGEDVVYPVIAKSGVVLASGQPYIEEFFDRAAWETRLVGLGFDTAKLPPLPKTETLTLSEAVKPVGLHRERARDSGGHFVGDDPSTPDVNEAWVLRN